MATGAFADTHVFLNYSPGLAEAVMHGPDSSEPRTARSRLQRHSGVIRPEIAYGRPCAPPGRGPQADQADLMRDSVGQLRWPSRHGQSPVPIEISILQAFGATRGAVT